MNSLRVDQSTIAGMIEPGSRVLDLGCGDGLLMHHLIHQKRCKGIGVEISPEGVQSCIANGVPVYQGDMDQGLSDHFDATFDYVLLSHTLQAIHRPAFVLDEMLRVGRRGVVSFPNFGHWRFRWQLMTTGRVPQRGILPHMWYDTPNIRMCTLLDFQDLCHELGIRIIKQIPLAASGDIKGGLPLQVSDVPWMQFMANWLSPMAVFLLEKE
ncbi:MAG: methionine biosynthesis protein MetW [Magnetococcales bacterium]|nr:methionine biosynthesis protein MetW [Magnetococcales bacterium]